LKRRLMQPISYYWTNNYMLLKNHHHTMLEININKEYSVKQNKNYKLLKKKYISWLCKRLHETLYLEMVSVPCAYCSKFLTYTAHTTTNNKRTLRML